MAGLRHTTVNLFAAPAAAVAVIASVLFLDKPLAWFCFGLGAGVHAAGRYLSLLGDFPAGFAACSVMLGLSLYLVYGRKRSVAAGLRLLFVPVSTGLSWALGNIAKVVFGRARPELLFQQGLYGFHFLRTDYDFNSFPSGHAVLATSFLFALSMILPRWRWPLWVLAVVVCLSRVVITAHYFSDVFAGALLAVAVVSGTRSIFRSRGPVFSPKEE